MKSRIKNTVSSDNEGITCPHCNVFAQHTFVQLSTTMELNDNLSPILEEINAAHFFPSAFHEYSIPTSIAVPMIHNCKYKYYCSQCIMCHDLCVWQYDGNNRTNHYLKILEKKYLHPMSSIISTRFCFFTFNFIQIFSKHNLNSIHAAGGESEAMIRACS